MAYTTTYATLVADLQDIVESTNHEFVAQIPKIIARAQDVVQRDLGLEIWRGFISTTTTSLSRDLTRNQAWLEVRSIFLPALGRPLEKRHIDWVRMYGPSQGVPKYWTEATETQIWLSPIPDDTYAIQIEILDRLPNLNQSNQTNWLTNNAADLLLLACLIGSELYLVSPDRLKEYMGMYAMLLAAAQSELRTQERAGYEPVRAAPMPSVSAGERA